MGMGLRECLEFQEMKAAIAELRREVAALREDVRGAAAPAPETLGKAPAARSRRRASKQVSPQIGERWRFDGYVIELKAHDGDGMIGEVVEAADTSVIGESYRISDLEFRLGNAEKLGTIYA